MATLGILQSKTLFSVTVFKYSIPNWSDKKIKLLELINNSDLKLDECQTDYFSKYGRGKYFNEWYSILGDDIQSCLEKINLPFADPQEWQLWSQKYYNGDYHSIHNHGLGNLSAVIYVEFDSEEHMSTKFYSPYLNPFFGSLNSMVLTDIREGDIIFFPAMLMHECPPQKSEKVRTIMSFNVPITK